MTLEHADDTIEEAISRGVFSGAQLLVAKDGRVLFERAFGRTRFGEAGRPVESDTLFDLASLTKPLAVGTAAAYLCRRGELDLDAPAGRYLAAWRGGDRRETAVRDLLLHASGLPAWRPYYKTIAWADDPGDALYRAVCEEALEHPPGGRAVYSDLDFIVLGRLIEALAAAGLDAFCEEEIYRRLGINDLFFLPVDHPGNAAKIGGRAVAATEDCPYRGLLVGAVHDDNAYAAGGVAGHAGLFGTARAVAGLLDLWRSALNGEGGLLDRQVAHRFVYPRRKPPRSSYVLAWDRPTWKVSQAGRHISPHAVGHLGFTGTSAWLDHDRDLIVVFLTNRVHPTRDENRIADVRRRLHNYIYETLGLTAPGPYRPPPPVESTRRIHLIAVAGTGMASLAGMLRETGCDVRGSDEAVYPPMSLMLERRSIPVKQPFSGDNLSPAPDLVVVGNVCTRDHVEVVELRRRGLAYDSFPGVLERFFLAGRKALVVAGTHGKTTTCSMLAWLLRQGGHDPGFMIGGLANNFDSSFRLGKGPYFVVEGDEYDSAYFDKYPKFMHYRPFGAIVTSLEYDHADIFDSVEKIEAHFVEFVKLIPESGRLVACFDYDAVRRVAAQARCPVISYATKAEAEWRLVQREDVDSGTRFVMADAHGGELSLTLPMSGLHNVANAMGAVLLLMEIGCPAEIFNPALAGFKGVARRQQLRGVVAGVRVIDDFAHHPTAVRLTLEGLRRVYPEGRLLAAFDPRTNTTSRNVFQKALAASFSGADFVVIGKPSRLDRIAPGERLDVESLVEELECSGVSARHIGDIDRMAEVLVEAARAGDTIAVMSNGSFGGLHGKLLERLGRRG